MEHSKNPYPGLAWAEQHGVNQYDAKLFLDTYEKERKLENDPLALMIALGAVLMGKARVCDHAPHKPWKRGETWLDEESLAYDVPLAKSPRQGMVRFADGKLRLVRLGIPDTAFSIPARSSKGKHGFVSVQNDEFRFTPRVRR